MPATITDLANGVSTTSNTTCVTGSTVTAAVGNWLVVVAASSNDGSGGAASQTGVVDSDGSNTYTQRALINYDPAAAGAGATLGLYTCRVTSALSLGTITVNHSGNTDQKAVQVYKLVPGVGEEISFIGADTTGVTGNLTSYAANTVAVTSGDTIFGAAAIETDDTVTGDTDTTNGSWSSILTRLADAGADASTMSSCSQYKTVTGTGNQSWACTTVTGRDAAVSYLVVRSASPQLSTVASSLAAGALLAAVSLGVTGPTSTPTPGSVGRSVSVPLSTVASGVSPGTVSPGSSPPITGNLIQVGGIGVWGNGKWGNETYGFSTGVGTVTPDISYPPPAATSVTTVGDPGSVSKGVSVVLGGVLAPVSPGGMGVLITPVGFTGAVSPGVPGTPQVSIAAGLLTVASASLVDTVTPPADVQDVLTGVSSGVSPGALLPEVSPQLTYAVTPSGIGSCGVQVETGVTGSTTPAQVDSLVPGLLVTQAISGVSTGVETSNMTYSLSIVLQGPESPLNEGGLYPSIFATLVGGTSDGVGLVDTLLPSILVGVSSVSPSGEIEGLTPTVQVALVDVLSGNGVGILALDGEVYRPLTGVSTEGVVGTLTASGGGTQRARVFGLGVGFHN